MDSRALKKVIQITPAPYGSLKPFRNWFYHLQLVIKNVNEVSCSLKKLHLRLLYTLFLFFFPRSEDCLSLMRKPISISQGFIRVDDLSIVFVVRCMHDRSKRKGSFSLHPQSMMRTKCKSCCKVHKIQQRTAFCFLWKQQKIFSEEEDRNQRTEYLLRKLQAGFSIFCWMVLGKMQFACNFSKGALQQYRTFR